MELTREEALRYIHEHPEGYLQKAKGGTYVCPVCNSGTGPNKTGITASKQAPHLFRCWRGCFERDGRKTADVPDIIAIVEGLKPGSKEALERAYSIYGITIAPGRASSTGRSVTPAERKEKPMGTMPLENYTDFYTACHARIGETDYPQKRGLTAKTINRFKLGYTDTFKTVDATKKEGEPGYYVTWEALVIPNGPNGYTLRNTDENAAPQNRYRERGVDIPFNLEALEQNGPVFIVEGQFDALSVMETGIEAIALRGAGKQGDLLKALEKNRPSKPLLLAFDNDATGEQAEAKLAADLNLLGIPYLMSNIKGEHHDVSEAWNAPGSGQLDFILAVQAAVNEAKSEEEKAKEAQRREYSRNSAAAYIEQFKGDIAASVDTPFYSTGYKRLDTVLDGGLYEGLYVLGAMPSIGKTTLALQIADNLARQGQDVLIFSLEMARTELMARSISRLTFLEGWETARFGRKTEEEKYRDAKKNAKSARGITSGRRYKNYSQAEKETIERAIDTYQGFADNIYIEEGMGDINAEQMRKTIENHKQVTGNTPVCIVDYMQIMAAEDDKASDKQNIDRASRELKRISRDYKTPVIAISSFNRLNYKKGVEYEAFKESGGIEYGADVVMGLYEKTKAASEAEIRSVELKIIKNRHGQRDWEETLAYYPMFNTFFEK